MRRFTLVAAMMVAVAVHGHSQVVNQHLIDSLKQLAQKFQNTNVRAAMSRNPDSMMKAVQGLIHLSDSARTSTIKEAMKKAPVPDAALKYLKDYNGGDTSYTPIYFYGKMYQKFGDPGWNDNYYNATIKCTSKKAPLTLIGSTYTVTLLAIAPTTEMAKSVTDNKVPGSLAKYVKQRVDLTANSSFVHTTYERTQKAGINLVSQSEDHSAPDGNPPQVQFIFSYDTLTNIGSVSCMRISNAHHHATKQELNPNGSSIGNEVLTKTENNDFTNTVAVAAYTDDKTWNLAAMDQNKANADLDKLTGGRISGSHIVDDGKPKPILTITREQYGFDLNCRYTETHDRQTTVITINAFIGKSQPDVEAIIYPIVPMTDSKNYTYEHWLPKGPKVDGTSPAEEGDTKLGFKLKIVDRKEPGKVYHNYTVDWRLEEVTKYDGYCNNYPKYTGMTDTKPDLRFAKETKNNQYFNNVTDNDAPTVAGKGEFGEVHINCMDYGAWGKLTAQVTLQDGTLLETADPYYDETKDYLTIPFDNDDNRLADWWEDSLHIKHLNHPLTWDEDNKPDKQRDNGDGYSLFEEYRGFAVHNANSGIDTFARTDPFFKDIFVYDPDKLFKLAYENQNPSKLRWHYVTKDQIVFLDNDKLNENHRWVNFQKVSEYYYANQYAIVLMKKAGTNPCTYGDGANAVGVTYARNEYCACNGLVQPGSATPDQWTSPVKNHIETIIWDGRITSELEGMNENSISLAHGVQLQNAVRHEIGHYLGIQHHHTTSPDKRGVSYWNNSMDGDPNCVMRNANPDESGDENYLTKELLKYCGPAETGFLNMPVVRYGPDGTTPMLNSHGEVRHVNQAIPMISVDNCYGQISVKSKP